MEVVHSELQMKALRLQVAFVPKNVYMASSILKY